MPIVRPDKRVLSTGSSLDVFVDHARSDEHMDFLVVAVNEEICDAYILLHRGENKEREAVYGLRPQTF